MAPVLNGREVRRLPYSVVPGRICGSAEVALRVTCTEPGQAGNGAAHKCRRTGLAEHGKLPVLLNMAPTGGNFFGVVVFFLVLLSFLLSSYLGGWLPHGRSQ